LIGLPFVISKKRLVRIISSEYKKSAQAASKDFSKPLRNDCAGAIISSLSGYHKSR